MATVNAEWGAYGGWRGQRDITDAQAALALCADIERDDIGGRVLVGFTTIAGHFFAIGLGAEQSCAVYWESVDPPYFQSLGTHHPDDRIDFAYDGEHTELPGTVRISREAAFQALAEFVETGQRPDCIEWEQT